MIYILTPIILIVVILAVIIVLSYLEQKEASSLVFYLADMEETINGVKLATISDGKTFIRCQLPEDKKFKVGKPIGLPIGVLNTTLRKEFLNKGSSELFSIRLINPLTYCYEVIGTYNKSKDEVLVGGVNFKLKMYTQVSSDVKDKDTVRFLAYFYL